MKDAVHGNIKIPPLCVAIMDTPQFQRLRDIKQLGGAPYVYPGGSHSRFEHSLGVCHLAGRLMRKLQEQRPDRISDKDVMCVQIAGLCHDMGHGPFSHAFEKLFLPKDKVTLEHEKIATLMIDHMLETEEGLKKKFEEWEWRDEKGIVQKGIDINDKEFIKRLIIGSKDDASDGRDHEKRFLYEVVNNKTNGVDVDKWDYIVRDCHHLGIGTDFDYNRMIESSRVIDKVKKKDGTIEDEPHICWRDKEIFNILQMFHTRYTLHKKVYQHRGIKAVEMMFMEALENANDVIKLKGKDGKEMTMAESVKDMEAYSKLTDSVFYQIKNSDDKKLEDARDLLLNVERRKLYILVAESPPVKHEEKVEGHVLMKMKKEIKSDLVAALRGELSERERERVSEIEKRLRIQVVVFNLGMTKKGGLYQFKKDSPDVATVADIKNFSLLGFPETLFNELVFQVYLVPSENPEAVEKEKKTIIEIYQDWQSWKSRIEQLLAEAASLPASPSASTSPSAPVKLGTSLEPVQ